MEFYLGSLFLGSQRSPKIVGILFEGFCFYVAVLTSNNAGLTQGSRIHLLLKNFLRGMVAEGTQQHCSILSARASPWQSPKGGGTCLEGERRVTSSQALS